MMFDDLKRPLDDRAEKAERHAPILPPAPRAQLAICKDSLPASDGPLGRIVRRGNRLRSKWRRAAQPWRRRPARRVHSRTTTPRGFPS